MLAVTHYAQVRYMYQISKIPLACLNLCKAQRVQYVTALRGHGLTNIFHSCDITVLSYYSCTLILGVKQKNSTII